MINHTETEIPVITIDGLSASGKGTIANCLATYLSWHLLDSGALYRAFAWGFAHENLPADSASYQQVILHLQVKYLPVRAANDISLFYREHKIDALIRDEEWAQMASKLAVIPQVRQLLLPLQRQARRAPGLVADGRDMGTVIFPNAILKFFLDADPEERAQRRYKQLKQQGINVSLAAVRQELVQRDHRDTHRAISPSQPGEDTIRIDTSNLSVLQVHDKIVGHVTELLPKDLYMTSPSLD